MYELIALKWITKLRQKNDEVKWNYLDWHTKKVHIINNMWIVNEWNDDIEHTYINTHTHLQNEKI